MPPAANGPNAPRTRRRRLLFALVPLAALLLVAEVAIRLVRAPLHFGSFRHLRTDLMSRNYPAELHPTLGYVPRPGFESRDNHWGTQVSIDADGMRRNGPGPPPPGDRVIAVVGDSFTFGDQVDDDDTWPAQLEDALGQPVKNGGVFGYSLTQAVLRAEAMLDRFRVSALVVSLIPDDLGRCEFERRYTLVPWFDIEDGRLVPRTATLDHGAKASDGAKAWKDLLGCSALVDAVLANTCRAWWYENEKSVRVPHLVGRGGEIGRMLIERVAGRCRREGVQLLVLLQGDQPTTDALAVLRHAEAHGAASLDLATRFVELSRADPGLRRQWFAGHMTRAGNGWVAREVAAALRGRG